MYQFFIQKMSSLNLKTDLLNLARNLNTITNTAFIATYTFLLQNWIQTLLLGLIIKLRTDDKIRLNQSLCPYEM